MIRSSARVRFDCGHTNCSRTSQKAVGRLAMPADSLFRYRICKIAAGVSKGLPPSL